MQHDSSHFPVCSVHAICLLSPMGVSLLCILILWLRLDFSVGTADCDIADITFIVDSSESIKQKRESDWTLVLDFVNQAITQLSQRSRSVRFGLITFSHKARLVFNLNTYNTTAGAIRGVSTMPYIGYTTNLADGCEMYMDSVSFCFSISNFT